MPEENEKKSIFVFGSNTAGIHGAGAARFASKYCGAEEGVGEGRTGEAYALPTKNDHLEPRTLTQIALSVQLFQGYATHYPDLLFQVTQVGCGLAGFVPAQIAPLFKQSPPNCGFDPEWKRFGLPTWEDIGIR